MFLFVKVNFYVRYHLIWRWSLPDFKKIFNFFVISFGRVVVPSPKIVRTFPGHMRIYPVKENPIGSAVSEILWYRHTDRHTDRQTSCYFNIRIWGIFKFFQYGLATDKYPLDYDWFSAILKCIILQTIFSQLINL